MNISHIEDSIERHFQKEFEFLIPKIFLFRNAYGESDYLLIDGNDEVTEIEIKTSVENYKGDFLKVIKHSILENSFAVYDQEIYTYDNSGNYIRLEKGEKLYTNDRPHKFYYLTPVDLISLEKVPLYAGLMYIDDGGIITIQKEAPRLHSENIDIRNRLLRTFYDKWKEGKGKTLKTKNSTKVVQTNSKKYFGVGYIGSGRYSIGQYPNIYREWTKMLYNCYSKHSSVSAQVDTRWNNFQCFAEWFDSSYTEKDWVLNLSIFSKNTRLYNEDNCCIVPPKIDKIMSEENRPKWSIVNNKDTYNLIITDVFGRREIHTYDTLNEAYEGCQFYKDAYFKNMITEFVDVVSPSIISAVCSKKFINTATQ